MKGILRVVAVVLLGVVAACGNQMSDAERVEKARELMDQGRMQAAVVELKAALQQNNSNPAARHLLGLAYWKIGNFAGAEKELRRAWELGVAEAVVLPLLAKTLLAQSKWDDLAALPVAKLADGTEKAEALAAQGLGKLASDDKKGGRRLIEQALAMAPEDSYVKVAWARFLATGEDKSQAYQVLKEVVAKHPNYAPAWSLLGKLHQLDKNLPEAEKAFSQAIDSREANTLDYLARLLVLIDEKKFDAAKQDLKVLLSRIPRHPKVQLAQGLIHLNDKKFDEAKEAFELSLKANDRQVMPKFYLAWVNFKLGNVRQAESYAEQAFSALPLSVAIREVLAAIKLRNQDYEKAESLLKPIVQQLPNDLRAVDLMASALLGQQRTEEALPLLETLVARRPDAVMAHIRFGAALLASGDAERGVRELEEALQKDPSQPLAYRLLFGHYLKNGQNGKARAVAEAYKESQPKRAEPWVLTGTLELEKGNETTAIEAFQKALQLEPGDPAANHALAALAVKKKDYVQARKRYEDVLARHEDHLPSLMKLALLDSVEKKENVMIEHLRRAIDAHPEAVAPRVMLARYRLLKGEPDKVASVMVPLGDAKENDPAVQEVMALASLAQKQFVEARLYLERLVKIRPDSAQSHFLLAKAYAGAGDVAKTREQLERVVALSPRALAPRLALARLALLQKDRRAAEAQIAEAERLGPGNADVIYLKGVLANIEGNKETAEQLMQQVFEATPNTKTMLAFAQQKWALGEPEEALAIQEQWVEQHPEDVSASLALSGALAQQGKIGEAIQRYEAVLDQDPNNVTALNNLAWYLKDKDPARAMTYARKGVDLAPDNVRILDTLAMVQFVAGQYQKAEETIARALLRAPQDPTLLFHMAMIKEKMGQHAKALELVESALKKTGKFAEREAAKRLLAKLKK